MYIANCSRAMQKNRPGGQAVRSIVIFKVWVKLLFHWLKGAGIVAVSGIIQ